MGKYGELFPGRKLQHEGDQTGISRDHEPRGPLDLESGVVVLAPRERLAADEQDETAGPADD